MVGDDLAVADRDLAGTSRRGQCLGVARHVDAGRFFKLVTEVALGSRVLNSCAPELVANEEQNDDARANKPAPNSAKYLCQFHG